MDIHHATRYTLRSYTASSIKIRFFDFLYYFLTKKIFLRKRKHFYDNNARSGTVLTSCTNILSASSVSTSFEYIAVASVLSACESRFCIYDVMKEGILRKHAIIELGGLNNAYLCGFIVTKSQMKSLLQSRYYTKACNEWRGQSPRLSAWTTQLPRNVTAVALKLNLNNSEITFMNKNTHSK